MPLRIHSIFTAALLFTASPAPAQPIDPKVQARIDRVLKRTPLIDGHNDLPWELREHHANRVEGLEDTTARARPTMTDMTRLRRGRVGAQFWSVFISGTLIGDEAVRTTIEQIDTARRLIRAYPGYLQFASTADDIVRIHRAGGIASMLGIEGGRQIGGSLPALRSFYDVGVRYVTLTHTQTTEWADSATDEPKHDGLSPFGIEVLREMNRLGMLIDLSHVSVATMKDSLAASRAPVIFSHSNAFTLTPNPRNVPDDVLRMVRENGGLVMLTFVPQFLSSEHWAWARERSAEEARLKSLFSFSKASVTAGLKSWEAARPQPKVGVKHVADHIEHVARTAGYDHVGIGGDLDGITMTVSGLDSVDDYPNLFAELIRRGWSDANLAKLAGGNLLRVLRRAEAVSASMRDQPAPVVPASAAKP